MPFSWFRERFHLPVLLNILAIAVVVPAAYRMASAATGGEINACVSNPQPGNGKDNGQGRDQQSGAIHIVQAGTPCPKGEEALSWNTQGPPGPPGPDSIAKLQNFRCPPGQTVNAFLADGTPICEPPLSPAGSAVVGGGTDDLKDSSSTMGMFAWGSAGMSTASSFPMRFGVIPVGGTLANFTVDVQYAPPAGALWTFSLVAATADHNLIAVGPNCKVTSGKYECLGAGTLAVQPGWTIFVLAGASTSGAVPDAGMAGWSATFQPGP